MDVLFNQRAEYGKQIIRNLANKLTERFGKGWSFYMEMCRLEHWDTRTLDEKIDAMLYERTALSRKPEELIKQELGKVQTTNILSPDIVFKSSYFLDAMGLPLQKKIFMKEKTEKIHNLQFYGRQGK